MKILMYTLALMSAFFVFAEPDMSDLVLPKLVPNGAGTCTRGDPDVSLEACKEIADGTENKFKDNSHFILNTESFTSVNSDGFTVVSWSFTCENCGFGGSFRKFPSYAEYIYNRTSETCPPDDYPEHTISVSVDDDTIKCAKPLEQPEPEPDDKCDEFGNNSMLPPKPGVGQEGQTACYTNPTTGLQCQYKQGGDNFIATGKTCDGDENDYGDKPTPEPPPDGADDNCYNYGSQGQVLICDVDPNEGCNPLLINGETQYQCPAGCGSMDGVYFCTYDDIDGDGVPDDKNQNGVPDNEETCVNGRCTPNTPTDGTGGETPTPTPETPDMTETNNRLDAIKGELGFIGGKIDTSNKKLDGINSGIQGLKGEQKASNSLLGSISNSNEQIRKNTGFTADNTGELLDSFNEFKEGFGETDIEGTFDPSGSASFYESEYEEGFEGVWNEKSLEFKQTETFNFLQQFAFNSGGSPPDTQMCFNLGSHMDFGCAELPTPSPQLLAILKVFILITAAFLCRALIFGG